MLCHGHALHVLQIVIVNMYSASIINMYSFTM